MTRDELEFAIFCIESLAEYLEVGGDEAYRLLTERTDILDNYIIPCYEPLHSQGKEYIVRDIAELLQSKGVLSVLK